MSGILASARVQWLATGSCGISLSRSRKIPSCLYALRTYAQCRHLLSATTYPRIRVSSSNMQDTRTQPRCCAMYWLMYRSSWSRMSDIVARLNTHHPGPLSRLVSQVSITYPMSCGIMPRVCRSGPTIRIRSPAHESMRLSWHTGEIDFHLHLYTGPHPQPG